MKILYLSLLTSLFLAGTKNAESQYLKRSLSSAREAEMELSTPSAHYLPLFGSGDDSSSVIKGPGLLTCAEDKVPVSKNDFLYIPAGKKFSLANPRERNLSVIVMGFRVMTDTVKPSAIMMIASADEVRFQVLGSHGPTTTFQLLMGTTESTRDKLAAACQVNSLFVMDFAASGTNIPHRHDNEEEIYFILRGKGDIVAGETSDGKELRHPSAEGDVYFFSPKTLIGFYSGNTGEEEHARILAVRFKYPAR